jgi:hypothetical protein
MLTVNVENIGDLAVVECEGRIVRSDAASACARWCASLRRVQSQH